MKFDDNNKMRGTFSLRAYDRDGNLVLDVEEQNLIVNGGKQAMALMLANGSMVKKVSQIAFGTDGTAPSATDTALTSSYKKNLDGFSFPDSTSVLYAWSLDFTEANGKDIQEFGLLCYDNTLFARRTRAVISKTSDLRLEGTWKIQL